MGDSFWITKNDTGRIEHGLYAVDSAILPRPFFEYGAVIICPSDSLRHAEEETLIRWTVKLGGAHATQRLSGRANYHIEQPQKCKNKSEIVDRYLTHLSGGG